jgi:toxin-antitoxin system PIN domain toxin
VILLDTNVLVYAVNADAPQHPESRAVVRAAIAGVLEAAVVPQVLLEFFSVATHPRRTQHPLGPEAAWQDVATFRAALPVLDPRPGALSMLEELVVSRRPLGGAIYDLYLAAQMRSHGIGSVCTYNGSDFAGVPGISTVTPAEVLANLPR